MSGVPRREELKYPVADRRTLKHTAVKKNGRWHHVFAGRQLLFYERSDRFTAVHTGSAAEEKARQVLADHRIGSKGKPELLQSSPACFLREVIDRGLRKKSVENHLF